MKGRRQTPVRSSLHVRDGRFEVLDRVEVERDAKVAELDVARFGAEDVGRCFPQSNRISRILAKRKRGKRRTLEVAMHDVRPVEVLEPFEDLDHVRRDERLGQLAKVLECLLQAPVLDVPVLFISSCSRHCQNEGRTRGRC